MASPVLRRKYLAEVYINGPEYNLAKLWPPKEPTSHRLKTRAVANFDASPSYSGKADVSWRNGIKSKGKSKDYGTSLGKRRERDIIKIEQSPPIIPRRRRVILHVTESGKSHFDNAKSLNHGKITRDFSPLSSLSSLSSEDTPPFFNERLTSQYSLTAAASFHTQPEAGPSSSKLPSETYKPDNRITLKIPSPSPPKIKTEKLTIRIPPLGSPRILKRSSLVRDTSTLHSPIPAATQSILRTNNLHIQPISTRDEDILSTGHPQSISEKTNDGAIGTIDSPIHLHQSPVVDPIPLTMELSSHTPAIAEPVTDLDASENVMVLNRSIDERDSNDHDSTGRGLPEHDFTKPSIISETEDVLPISRKSSPETQTESSSILSNKHIETDANSSILTPCDDASEIQMSSITEAEIISDASDIADNLLSPVTSDIQEHFNPIDSPSSTTLEDLSSLSSPIVSEDITAEPIHIPEKLIEQTHITITSQIETDNVLETDDHPDPLSMGMEEEPALRSNSLDEEAAVNNDLSLVENEDDQLNTPVQSPNTDTSSTPSVINISTANTTSNDPKATITLQCPNNVSAIPLSKTQSLESISGTETNYTDSSSNYPITESSQEECSCKVIKNNHVIDDDDWDSDEDLGELEYPDWDPEELASQINVKYKLLWDLPSSQS